MDWPTTSALFIPSVGLEFSHKVAWAHDRSVLGLPAPCSVARADQTLVAAASAFSASLAPFFIFVSTV